MNLTSSSVFSSDSYLQRILAIVQEGLKGKHVSVYLFGSRAEGRPHRASDYDLAVDAPEEEDLALHRIRDALEESTVPYMVDVVDLRLAEVSLKNHIKEKGILLWKN